MRIARVEVQHGLQEHIRAALDIFRTGEILWGNG
jgi:hypothetical protein